MTIGGHIEHSPSASISKFSPYSALILSIVLVVLFLIRFYVLQRFLLEKLHGSKYTDLDDANRRSFLNHYISAATKLAILLLAIYPFGAVAFGTADFHTPYVPGSRVKMGDLLLIAAQMLSGMFIFELIYRVKISPVSVAHHIGSIMVAQAAITISIERERVSTIEFILCTVWGAFDIVAEFIPHVALIMYRVYPTSHFFLANIFKFAAITTFMGTISETILVMYLFGVLWNRWPLAFKIATPLLHCAFAAAQFHGSRIFYLIWRKQEQLLKEEQMLKKEQLLKMERDCEK